ncbi:MAG: NAD(P)H-dependent oxidoreductase [Spirochaetales bacterium]|nr:NAD(P)H-dependent oxidoreductase [Spirochaetales bacterium]
MSNTIIIYYSLEGNIDFLARAAAKEGGAELCRLETVKEYPKKGLMKFLHGGRDASFGFKPELKTTLPDLSAYERIIIGTPVWASKPAAPISSFLDKANLTGKNVSLIVSSAGGSPAKCIDIITKVVTAKGGIVTDSLAFVNPLKKPQESLDKIKNFIQHSV